jgi:hypothetical protein
MTENIKGWKDKNELPNQIKNLRTCTATQGSVYFSSKTFNNNPNGWNDSLQQNYYSTPAIVPPMPWIDNENPATPIVTNKTNTIFNVIYKGKKAIKNYALFIGLNKKEATLKQLIAVNNSNEINIDDLLNDRIHNKLFIASVSINNNISELIEVK